MKTEKLRPTRPDLKLAENILNATPDASEQMMATAESMLLRQQEHGRYLIEKELARGGMGIIYTVYDQDLRRITAMKVVPPQIINLEEKLRAFVDEARITAQLEHPHIVPIHEIGVLKDSGCPYYTMKLVHGEPLSKIIKELSAGDQGYHDRFPRHRLLDIFLKVCNAVAYAHVNGVIHRDIKPENIMVGDFGEVLLMDWGLAKFIDAPERAAETEGEETVEREEVNIQQTQDGDVKGSLAYMAPEQAYGEVADIDRTTDIFLLGGTLYHMFTYDPPYTGKDMIAILTLAERCDYVLPSAKNPRAQIPKALEQIILKAMSPLKQNRYQRAEDLIADIEAFQAGKRACGFQVFAKGEHLIFDGDASKDTYVIISGRVAVHRKIHGRDVSIATIGAGEIVGEMAGITHSVRTATVTALETTETLVITHDLMLDELQKLAPWMEQIVFSLTERVTTLSKFLHPLLLEAPIFPVVNQLYMVFASAQLQADDAKKVVLRRSALVEEVTMNLGLDLAGTEAIIDVLVQDSICAESAGKVSVPDIRMFGIFIDFCRYSMEIHGGIKRVQEIRIAPDTEAHFRQVVKRLNRIGEQLTTT